MIKTGKARLKESGKGMSLLLPAVLFFGFMAQAQADTATVPPGFATDTQPFVCKDETGAVVADSFCTGVKPADNTRQGSGCGGVDIVIVQSTSPWVKSGNGDYYGNAVATCPAGYTILSGSVTCHSQGGSPTVFNNTLSGNGEGAGCVNVGSPGTGDGVLATAYCGKAIN